MLTERINHLQNIICFKNQLLFNAFALAKPEAIVFKEEYDYDDMSILAEAFYNYILELENMGRHPLQVG